MANPKPIAGYASRTAAVLALRAQNMTPKQVATQLGLRHGVVCALESSARRTRKRSEHERTVLFPLALLAALEPHAARRGISPNELARRLVEEALEGKLIDAVLDDGGVRDL